MPRYLIERIFSKGLQISADTIGVDECLKIVSKNLDDEVTWIQSYVSDDKLIAIGRSYQKYHILKSGNTMIR